MIIYQYTFKFYLVLLVSILMSFVANSDEVRMYPAFDFKDWPVQIVDSFEKNIPEIKNKRFSEYELNVILKKIAVNYPIENLKIIEKDNILYLLGLRTVKVTSINYNVSSSIGVEDFKSITGLNVDDAENENKINQAEDKIKSYLKNLGYRNTKISTDYKTLENLNRVLNFNIQLGSKTLISQILILGLDSKLEKTKFENSIYWYGVGDILSDDKLKILSQQLRIFLSQSGYYLISVPSPQVSFNQDDTQARLTYKLQLKQKYKVELIGAKNYSDLFLATDVLKLDSYFSTENNFGSELSEKLRIFYFDKGFSRFEVTYYERKENQTVVLSLNMDEGQKTYIEKISVAGQITRDEKFYSDQYLQLASQKIQDQVWVKPDADQAAKNLITSLQNEGFVSAQLNRIEPRQSATQSQNIDLAVIIEEGPAAVIESIEFKNNLTYPKAVLLEKMGLRTGQMLNLNELEKALINLKIFYTDNGFIESQILNDKKNLITYNSDYTKAQIEIELNEGVPISVGSIVLDGNKLTHDKLILTELEFRTGDLLTPQKIEESISRLQKTGHFSSINIYSLEANTALKERTIVVKVSERKPILLTLGIGATNENERTFHAYGGLAHRNLGGWGRGISGRGELNYNDVFLKFLEKKVTLGYLEPYLFDTRVRFRINYTTQASVSDVILRKQTITNSAVWALEQDFTSHITGLWDIYNIANYVEKGMTIQDEQNYKYSGQDFAVALTGPTIDIDYRDQILNPQSGHFSRLSLEYASETLGNHKVDDFIRTTAQTTVYIPIVKDQIIWANSVRGGYVNPVGKTVYGIPYDKKGFILGGRSTIRGFESTEFFPTSDDKNSESLGANYKFTQPASFQLIKSELRFPLFPKHDISAAVFYDGGQVLIQGLQFSDSYRDVIGLGFRYNTPVGPLNLEYAHKLDRKPSESEGAFHLSVGVF